MRKIRVNPAKSKEDWIEHRIVYDALGRQIKYKPEGNLVNKDTHISRAVKAGDLVVVKEFNVAVEKQPTEKKDK